MNSTPRHFLATLAAAVIAAACSTAPQTQTPAPTWQANAQGSLQRFTVSYLKGERSEAADFERARSELASTGQAGMVARAELTRCAVKVASLVFEPCEGFERLRRDAPAAERAYADYIAGRITPADAPLVPEQHRAIAAGREDMGTLQGIADPVSRLVAAGVLMRTGRASPQVVQVAVDTASQQGWRRPLLAWLGVQAQRAERAGNKEEAERIRRRIALVTDPR